MEAPGSKDGFEGISYQHERKGIGLHVLFTDRIDNDGNITGESDLFLNGRDANAGVLIQLGPYMGTYLGILLGRNDLPQSRWNLFIREVPQMVFILAYERLFASMAQAYFDLIRADSSLYICAEAESKTDSTMKSDGSRLRPASRLLDCRDCSGGAGAGWGLERPWGPLGALVNAFSAKQVAEVCAINSGPLRCYQHPNGPNHSQQTRCRRWLTTCYQTEARLPLR